MKYDLYDFDKTVYPYDSETVFLFHCLFRKPWLLMLSPWLLLNLILFFLGFGDKFWEKQEKKIYPFFRPENRERPTVVCSASPEFLLRPICEKYGVDTMIATRMDPRTGTIIGRNCKDKQKPLRIAETLPNAEFVNVYSDSLKNDIHIFRLGERCFHAKKGVLTETTVEEIEKHI